MSNKNAFPTKVWKQPISIIETFVNQQELHQVCSTVVISLVAEQFSSVLSLLFHSSASKCHLPSSFYTSELQSEWIE